MNLRSRLTCGLAALVAATAMAACSPASAPGSGSTPQPTTAAAAPTGVSFTDTYVKSASQAGDMSGKSGGMDMSTPMSAMFGVLENAGSQDVTLVKASSDVAKSVELHEMVMENGAMKMQPKSGGFVISAGQSVTLAPGGLHIMLIGLTRDIKAGDPVSADLTFADGSTLTVEAVGRDLPNANESYAPKS